MSSGALMSSEISESTRASKCAAAFDRTDALTRTALIWRNAALSRNGPGPLVAVTVLVSLLAAGWITDFRYVTQRAHDGYWRPYAESLVTACDQQPTGRVILDAWGGHPFSVPCTRIRR